MKPRGDSLMIAALLAFTASPLVAQEPVQTPDTSAQGYAPSAPTPPPPAPAATAAPAPAPAAAAPAPAAAPAATAPAAGRSVAEALGFVDVLPARSADRIRNDLESAKADEREADARISETSSDRAQTKAMVEVKKQEISTIDARIKLADKQKAEADKTTLEADKKVSEREKQFLERREALHAAELDQAKAAKKLAESDQKALELELSSPAAGTIGPRRPATPPPRCGRTR